ncbi:hypothetical protein [Pseudomonas sp. BP8]|nr:hypothetical protein [Pseudomonas sp. BP8]MBP2261317.1 hypothetical protein [Pseudomonas sp. BP8]
MNEPSPPGPALATALVMLSRERLFDERLYQPLGNHPHKESTS